MYGVPSHTQSHTRRPPHHPHVPPRIASTFDTYDANGSGLLDYTELRSALRDCALDVATKTARKLVLAYDDDHDGKLSLLEFHELVKDVEAGLVRRPRNHKMGEHGGRRGSLLSYGDEDELLELHHGLRAHYGNVGAGEFASAASSRRVAPSSVTAVAEAMAAAPPAALLAVRRPLVSPLIAARRGSPNKRRGGGGGRGGDRGGDRGEHGDGLLDSFGFLESGLSMPMLSSLFNQNRQLGFFSLEYEAQGALEEWLESLPGLQPLRPPVLLGVRPLERAEAIARVLRCECTFWEAQRAYVDSHKLYLRQWIALELQALYRMHKAKREAHRRRNAGWEEKMKQSLGYWRNQTVTRCFVAWRMLVHKTHRAWAAAEQAVVKMYRQNESRAFNTWRERTAEYVRNKRRIADAARMMGDPIYRAYRVWKREAAASRRQAGILNRCRMAIVLPEQRWALTNWHIHYRYIKKLKGSGGRMIRHWRNRLLSVCFNGWRRLAFPPSRRDASSDAPSQEEYEWMRRRQEMLSRPCYKRGRYTELARRPPRAAPVALRAHVRVEQDRRARRRPRAQSADDPARLDRRDHRRGPRAHARRARLAGGVLAVEGGAQQRRAAQPRRARARLRLRGARRHGGLAQ